MGYESAVLIYAQSQELGTAKTHLWQPPLGLMSMATYARQENHSLAISVLNEEIENDRLKINSVDAQVIGISAGLLNYERAISLAEQFKERGSTIIFGGPYSSVIPKNILRNRKCVDYVVVGEGEEPFYKLMSGFPPESIEGVAYRKGSDIHIPLPYVGNINSRPVIDRSLVNLQDYFVNWRNIFPNNKFRTPTTIYSQGGCTWRNQQRGCVFCARTDLHWRGREPTTVWSEIMELNNQYGVDYIRDLSDSFPQNIRWLKKFVETKPDNLNLPLRIWARSDQINEKTIEYLLKLNVHDVFLGTESGDREMLQSIHKGITPNDNVKAVKLLKDHGIKTFVSFVLGLPGETEKSLDNTVRHVEHLLNVGEIETLVSQILKPIPGSRAFSMLTEKTGNKYSDRDLFDVEELRADWVRHFCNVDYDYLVAINQKIQMSEVPMKYFK